MLKTRFSTRDQLLTLGMAILGPHYSTYEVAVEDFQLAREMGLIAIEGARMLRMQDRIGSLTPGKQADVVLVRASDLNMQPIHDPVTSVITQTSVGNVDTVLVAGQIKKRHGQLLASDVGAMQNRLAESGQRTMRDLQALLH